MSNRIRFVVDRKKAVPGEYVTVTWTCEDPDSVSLTVDNGISVSNVQLADNGSRVVLIEQGKGGKTSLRLNAVFNGKVERQSIEVRTVSPSKPKRRRISLKASWEIFRQRLVCSWRSMPEKTRRIYKILAAVLAAFWLAGIAGTCTRTIPESHISVPSGETVNV